MGKRSERRLLCRLLRRTIVECSVCGELRTAHHRR
ncbi:MAG: 50S ribosomal protein L32 [Halobacteriales archaeon]